MTLFVELFLTNTKFATVKPQRLAHLGSSRSLVCDLPVHENLETLRDRIYNVASLA